MDGWLKILIAAACVVVIGGGAYYGWKEYRQSQALTAARDAAALRATARQLEQTRQARLTSDYCNTTATSALSKVSGSEFRTPDRIADLKECYQRNLLGYVESRDLIAEGLFK